MTMVRPKEDNRLPVKKTSVSACRSCGNAVKRKEFISSDYHYRVQVGTFRNYNSAFDFQLQLFEMGYSVDIEPKDKHYTVLVGEYADMDEAVITESVFRNSGYNTILIAVAVKEE